MSEYSQLAELVTLRPLEARQPIVDPQRAPFSASWSSTVGLLAKELRLHGARRGVLELDLREQDFRIDGLPRANARQVTPTIVLSFEATAVSGWPMLRYEVGTFRDWRDNVRAVALGLESLRAVDRHGVTRKGEQYAGWKQLEAGDADGDVMRGRMLIVQAGSVAKALHAAHPDHGGTDRDLRDVVAAREADR